jgi:hypothetical protein
MIKAHDCPYIRSIALTPVLVALVYPNHRHPVLTDRPVPVYNP